MRYTAVKFTDHGDVKLHIDAPLRQLGAAPTVVFSVTDTGIGIGAENLTSIFSAFQQGDGTTSRRYGGTGLGLAICREVAAQLEMYDMTVVNAPDGRKAIAELAAGDIDLVLMDVMMPLMDGYETTRAIRQMSHASPTSR